MQNPILKLIGVVIIIIIGVWLVKGGMFQTVVSNQNTGGDIRNVDMLGGATSTEIVSGEASYYGTAKGWYAEPKEAGEYPGVIMIHEWWGLNDHIKSMAGELAKQGYRVLAVDLYNGKVATSTDQARALTSAVEANPTEALRNMKAAAKYLRDDGATKVASLGWCFGGGQSLQLSLSDENLDATVIYYGTLVTDKAKLAAVDEPLLGIFGETDASIPVATVQQFDKALDELGKENAIHIYPGVGHAFANPSGMNYAAEPTKDAWAKTLQFLADNLKS